MLIKIPLKYYLNYSVKYFLIGIGIGIWEFTFLFIINNNNINYIS